MTSSASAPAEAADVSSAPDVEFTVTISGQPLVEMAPETRAALMAMIELAREQATAYLAGRALPAPSLQLVDRLRTAIARWDDLARAQAQAERIGDRQDVKPAREAFEDAFNLAIPLFEKEYPHGHG
jgi:hypothetical protein